MRVIISAVVTAVVLFFFGFVWWGMLMPLVKPAEVIADPAIVESMSGTFPESGLYIYPDYGDAESHAKPGPMAFVYYYTDQPNMGKMMGSGFAHMVITALLASWIVSMCNRPSYGDRVTIVFFLGLFVAIWADIGNMIWWRHPPLWTIFHVGYDVVSWLIAGLVIAAIVRPAIVSSEPTD